MVNKIWAILKAYSGNAFVDGINSPFFCVALQQRQRTRPRLGICEARILSLVLWESRLRGVCSPADRAAAMRVPIIVQAVVTAFNPAPSRVSTLRRTLQTNNKTRPDVRRSPSVVGTRNSVARSLPLLFFFARTKSLSRNNIRSLRSLFI